MDRKAMRGCRTGSNRDFQEDVTGWEASAAMDLYGSAQRWKAAWLRQCHSDWTEKRVQQEVTQIFKHART